MRKYPITNTIFTNLKKFWQEYRFPISLGLAVMGALYIVVFLGLVMMSSPDFSANTHSINLFTFGWFRWDYAWYRQIAEIGYKIPADFSSSYDMRAFFPFYPLLIRFFNFFTHNYDTAALMISNLAFIWALVVLYSLTKQKFGVSVAEKTLIILCAFPFSFYFVAAYTESIFLLLALAAFYFGEKQKWVYAALMAAFAGATKAMGIFVTIGLLFLYLEKIDFKTKLIKKDILWLLIGFSGLIGYMVYLAVNFGSPFAFLEAEYTWLGQYHVINVIFGVITYWLSGGWQTSYIMLHLTIQMMVIILFFFLIIKMLGNKNLGTGYLVYSLLMFLVSFRNWYGMGRYVIVIFPLFIVFAKLFKNDRSLLYLVIFFVLLQSLLVFMFAHSLWVA